MSSTIIAHLLSHEEFILVQQEHLANSACMCENYIIAKDISIGVFLGMLFRTIEVLVDVYKASYHANVNYSLIERDSQFLKCHYKYQI